jgi:hypothetical protein
MNRLNIASLPREEAIRVARAAGVTIGLDNACMSEAFYDLRASWIGFNCPASVGQTDDEFEDLIVAVCDVFEEGFNEAYPEELPAPVEGKFKSGLNVALDLLRTWAKLGEDGINGQRMMHELLSTQNSLPDAERVGFSNTVMGYLMLVLQGFSAPHLPDWSPVDDLAQWYEAGRHV